MANGISYQLDLDNAGFQRGLGEARSAVSGFSALVRPQMMMVAASVAGAALAVKGVSTAFREARAAVGEAANRETMETAFVPLLGSANAARERMAELADFAAHTPFQLPGIAAASRTLESLTDGALSTGDGLRLVGDAASAQNTPIEEMAVTIGRLYSGLDSGRPVGEAMQRLQELGAISPDVRAKLEKLQAEGKKGSEVWQVAAEELARFSGGMELQSQTWNGKISTLSDNWAQVRAEFGKPIMDALKPLLDEGIGSLESMAAKAREIGETIAYAMRFMIEAFKQGEAWNLAKLGLTLAFQESVNFLWRVLMGVFEAIPQYLVQAFKQGIMILDILTDAAFWRMVGNVFVGVMRMAVNGLLAYCPRVSPACLTAFPDWVMRLIGCGAYPANSSVTPTRARGRPAEPDGHLLILTATGFSIKYPTIFPPFKTPFLPGFRKRRTCWTHQAYARKSPPRLKKLRHPWPPRTKSVPRKKKRTPPRVSPGGKRPRTTRRKSRSTGKPCWPGPWPRSAAEDMAA